MLTCALRLVGLVALCFVLAACQRNGADSVWNTYGESPMGEGDAVAIGSLRGGEENVVIHGTIIEVCKIKGCWMTIRDQDGRDLFVQFKDYSFFVPRDAVGRLAVIRGRVERVEMDVDELRHYAADAKKSPDEIAAITEPEVRTTFYADSVMIAGRGLDKPYEQQPGEECEW